MPSIAGDNGAAMAYYVHLLPLYNHGNLKGSITIVEKALRDCGLSEWVLCQTGTVETVQEAY